MSVPYMDRGFELVVKEKIVAADLMAWAQVFLLCVCVFLACAQTYQCAHNLRG